MEYRSLGRTGVQVSPSCLGCMMFGAPGKTTEADSIAIIHKALDAGINFLDTANVYTRGISEEYTGRAITQYANGSRRDWVVLATKLHGKMRDDDPNSWNNHRKNIVESVEASLRRLQTDYIDLLQIHRPNSDVPIDETLRALDDVIRSGKVRYIGTSTYAAWQVVESLWVSKELGLNRFVCEQPPYQLLDRRIERELVPMARTYGIGLIPWSPLASGFLTGKYKRGQKPPADARIQEGGWRSNLLLADKAYDIIEAVEKIAAEKSATASQVALAWCRDQPGVTSPIIGPRTMEQFQDHLKSLDVKLTDDDRKKLDEVAAPGRATVPYYDADFGPHKQRW